MSSENIKEAKDYFHRKLKSHPNFVSISVEDDKLKISFKTDDSLLMVKGFEGDCHKQTGTKIIYVVEEDLQKE